MDPKLTVEEDKPPPIGVLKGKKILFSIGETQPLYNQGMFGTLLKNGELALDPFEAGILLERRRIQITKDKDQTSFFSIQEFLELFGLKDKTFWGKYLVYKDLKDRGYPVKPGLGDIIGFRVYPRGSRPGSTPPPGTGGAPCTAGPRFRTRVARAAGRSRAGRHRP